MKNFNATSVEHFHLDGDHIVLEIEDSKKRFSWRLTVNGDRSPIFSYFEGISSHKEWYIATGYWCGTFPEFVPFKIVTSNKGTNWSELP